MKKFLLTLLILWLISEKSGLTGLILKYLKLFLYHSIALKRLFKISFEFNSIRTVV